MTPLTVLQKSDFGKRTAEEEKEKIERYFVETENWRRVYKGEVDVIYGAKGSGKSALYNLILKHESRLLERGIILKAGENPEGTPAFSELKKVDTRDSYEIRNTWKLYILSLIGQSMKKHNFSGREYENVIRELEYAQLIPDSFSLAKLLRYVSDYVKAFVPKTLEGGVDIDQYTGMPTGLTGRIIFNQPGRAEEKRGIIGIDELFEAAGKALEQSGKSIWILLDRLDVAFSSKDNLEKVALRGLFECYKDIKKYSSIKLKIFLRTDIWNDLTEGGFREASHIEKSLTIKWSPEDLADLVTKRIASNQCITDFYNIQEEDALESYEKKQEFLNTVFPRQVENGKKKPQTALKWVLRRTCDASKIVAPRELIHFLDELRQAQINLLELGQHPTTKPSPTGKGEPLFAPAAFKTALKEVSSVRLEQTLYAEFPDVREYLEKLIGHKSTQSLSTLAKIWEIDEQSAYKIASRLSTVGFFESKNTHPNLLYDVPFLYRPALKLKQGVAKIS